MEGTIIDTLYTAYREAIKGGDFAHAIEVAANIADRHQTNLSADVLDILTAVADNNGYCPCLDKCNEMTLCPCLGFRSRNVCGCELFVKGTDEANS